VGLLADFQYTRRERPVSSDRTADVFGASGSSQSKFIVYTAPGGIGAYATFYTVPSGKVFLLRKISSGTGANLIRINGVDTFEGGTDEEFDPPIKYESGTAFGAWSLPIGTLYRLVGVEEDLSVQASRNFY
jgi:hypothetical protein